MIFAFGLNSCGDTTKDEPSVLEDDSQSNAEIVEEDSVEVTEELEVLSVVDYYYLLPSTPYFESENDEDSEKAREEGLSYLNENSGYLKGGHYRGSGFTMALFKNREENIDYIMLQRLPYPGSMFEEFFHFLTYKDGEWISAENLFEQADEERDKNYTPNLSGEQIISPMIPEKGTTLEFHIWNPFEGDDFESSELAYSYKWNGVSFEFVE